MKHLTFILLLVMTCSLAKAQQDDRGYIVKVGEKAPNIELLFPDGTKKQLKDLKGKVIMIQFTASWCGVCRKEMPSTPTPHREPELPVTSSSIRRVTSLSSPVSTTRKNLRKW